MDDIFSWVRGVKTVNSFLDESYTVSLLGRGVSGPGRIPWGRIGVEKFYARVIPLITGSREAKRLTSTIRTACHDAICYGNSTILVFDDGSIAVSDPMKSVATRNRYGSVIFESHEVVALNPMPLPELVSVDGTLMARNWDAEEGENPYVVVGRSFSIFFKEGPRGQSRITPAIQRIIEAQARSELRTEEAENFYTWPMRIINGVWDGFAEEMGGDVKQVLAGMAQILAIPRDPETGEKASTETWSGGDPSKPEVTKQSRMKDTAAAFNIDAQELGFTSSQFSSAEAISTAKEDLVLEIQEFTENIFPTIEDFMEFAALVRGFPWGDSEDFSWASPSTPSVGSRTDAFVKIASVIPAVKYSKEAILEAGLFSPKVIESLFRDRDAQELVQLSIQETEAQLRGQIEAAGGEA